MAGATTDVVLIDDSDIFAELCASVFDEADGVRLVARASNGRDGVRLARRHPDAFVLMDVHMPIMGGLDAVRALMEEQPRPILMLSAVDGAQATMCFEAMQAGALDFLAKPGSAAEFRYLVRRVRMLAGCQPRVTAVRPAVRGTAAPVGRTRTTFVQPAVAAPAEAPTARAAARTDRMLGVAVSTGGPAALAAIVPGLPASLPVPVVVVQHMAAGFENDLVSWLRRSNTVRVELVTDGARPEAGTVYLCPPGAHVVVDARRRLRLDTETAPRLGHRPSGSVLFHSMARHLGADAIGVVLTGMGDDGSDGLLAMREAGAVTIAQDAASSTIDGMPRASRENGAAQVVASLTEMPSIFTRAASGTLTPPHSVPLRSVS